VAVEGASRTALGSAYWRAAHLRDDPPPSILEDRIAARLLGDDVIAELESPLAGWDQAVVAGFRVAHAVRARIAEDVAVAGLGAGRSDYAIVGAGLDTFAWRHPRASRFTVWEYDRAATQAWKQQAITAAGLQLPHNVRFVPIDLSRTRLDTVDVPSPATWSWLGVTVYLTELATSETLDVIAHTGGGATLIVDFVLPRDERDELALAAGVSAASLVASVGEPVVSTYRRRDVEALLRDTGFTEVELLDATELSRRYLQGGDHPALPGSTVIAIASV
jgi:methyltransferase (TIGR00027 family)